MRPLRSVDLATGEPGEALVERSDVQAVEALAVVAEAAVAWELARAAREKFGGDALARLRRGARRLPRADRVAANALDRHLALVGFMGAGKSTLGPVLARAARTGVRLGRRGRRGARRDADRRDSSTTRGEAAFRELEEEAALDVLLAAPAGGRRARRRRARLGADARRARGARVHRAPRGHGRRGLGRASRERSAARARPERRSARSTTSACRSTRRRTRRARDLDGVVLAAAGIRFAPHARGARRRGRRRRARRRAPRRRRGASRSRGEARRRSPRPSGSGGRCALDRASTLVAVGGGTTTDLVGFVAATYMRGVDWVAVPVDARRPGRRGDRRQDGDRPPGGEEPRRRLPLARRDGHRHDAARDAPRGGAAERPRRGREDGAPRRRAALGARHARSRCAAAPRSRRRSASAIRTSAASARSSTSATRSRTRSRRHRTTRVAARARGRARAPRRAAALRARRRGADRRGGPRARRRSRSTATRAWAALQRDKKARRTAQLRLVLLDAPGRAARDLGRRAGRACARLSTHSSHRVTPCGSSS